MAIRNPLKRALSIYYFWGELWKMKNRINEERQKHDPDSVRGRRRKERPAPRISQKPRRLLDLHDAQHGGSLSTNTASLPSFQLGDPVVGANITPIHGALFVYHGDELSAPPENIAMAYATHLPLKKGMPGPSFTWSCYAQSVEEAIQGFESLERPHPLSHTPLLKSHRISPVVTERLDESLIVLSSHLSWSVADLVNVMPRKVWSLVTPPLTSSSRPFPPIHPLPPGLPEPYEQ